MRWRFILPHAVEGGAAWLICRIARAQRLHTHIYCPLVVVLPSIATLRESSSLTGL